MFKRLIIGIAAVVASASSLHAGPEDYDRIVSFGDSLSDVGNAAFLTSILPPEQQQPPPGLGYFLDSRFSNGPVWTELLAGGAGSMSASFATGQVEGDVNFAVGGATAAPALLPPGVPLQIAAFAGLGGEFESDDLVTVLAGANDIFNALPGAATPGQIQQLGFNAASSQTQNAGALIGLQAKTILAPNLPDLGRIPLLNGSLNTAFAGTLATAVYNQTLDQGLEQLAADNRDVNIIQMDLETAFNLILGNKEAFGFTNVSDACLLTPGCTPDSFLFWDEVHPSAAGHELIALYASLLLSADESAKALAPLSQASISTRLEASDILFRQGIPVMPHLQTHQGLYAEVVGQEADRDGGSGFGSFDYGLYGIRAGFDANAGAARLGAAIAMLEGDLDGEGLSSDMRTTQADIYGVYSFAPFFAGVEGGFSYTEYDDIRRDTGFPTVTAKSDTESVDYNVAAAFGTHWNAGSVVITPALRIGYLSSEVEGFDESSPILALAFEDRRISAGFWSARLRAAALLSEASKSFAYLEGGYEDLFSIDDEDIDVRLIGNTAKPFSANADDPEARGFFLKAGIGGKVTETITMTAEYGLSLPEDGGYAHAGRLQVKVPLHGY